MMTTETKQDSATVPVYTGPSRKHPRFSVRDLALLGVLSALATILNFAVATVMHATGIIAIPGVSSFVMSFVASVVIYAVLRKVPKPGALTILAATNALITMTAMGHMFVAIGLLLGGVAGDLYMRTVRGHEGRWSPIVAIVLYRAVRELAGTLVPILAGVTQARYGWYIIAISIAAGVIGALAGGISGRSLMDRLSKSGAVK